MAFAREVSDLVVFMDAGKIVISRPANLLENPRHERLKAFLSRLEAAAARTDRITAPRNTATMISNRPDIRPALGLRRIINVSGTMTSLGASIVVPEAVQMVEGILTEFVEINELHRSASQAIGGRPAPRRLHDRLLLRRHYHCCRRLHDRCRSGAHRAASGHRRG